MYESHVTVSNLNDTEFIAACAKLGVKPVIIEGDTGSHQRQMMTARFHKTNNQEQALKEMHGLADQFDHVVRRKLEKIVAKEMPSHLYLEFHLKYEVDKADLDEFILTVMEAGGHTSRNMVKQTQNDLTVYQFATARSEEVFQRLLVNLSSYRRINVIRECVVFDDNPLMDTGWCGCECGFKLLAPI